MRGISIEDYIIQRHVHEKKLKGYFKLRMHNDAAGDNPGH